MGSADTDQQSELLIVPSARLILHGRMSHKAERFAVQRPPRNKTKERRMLDPETEYWMVRARQEAAMADQATHPAAAAAHRSLALRYSAKAAMDIAEGAFDPVDSPDLWPVVTA